MLAAVLDARLLEGVVEPENLAVSMADCSVRARATEQHLVIALTHKTNTIASARISTGGVACDGRCKARIAVGGEARSFTDWMNKLPPTVFFADGTSSVSGTIGSIPQQLATLTPNSFQRWDWSQVDIRSESRAPQRGYKLNIQTATVNEIKSRTPNAYIVIDDGANEIADVVVLSEGVGRRIDIDFYHCKWSSEDEPGHRLKDLTEVLAQVSRGVRWAQPLPKLLAKRLIARLEDRPERLRNGDMETLRSLLSELCSGSYLLSLEAMPCSPV